jgi:hypothetical protein
MLSGRGLRIVEALTDRWGYTLLSGTGKVVWAHVAFQPAGNSREADAP